MQHLFYNGNSDVAEAVSFEGPEDVYVVAVRVHLSAAGGANTMYVKTDSAAGPEYDMVLGSQDMTAVTDKVFSLGEVLRAVDGLTITWTNASSRVYGIEVIYRAATEWD